MGYTKQMADENRRILARCHELLEAEGYDPKEESKYDWPGNRYAKSFQHKLLSVLVLEFPDVHENRIKKEINKALRQARAPKG